MAGTANAALTPTSSAATTSPGAEAHPNADSTVSATVMAAAIACMLMTRRRRS